MIKLNKILYHDPLIEIGVGDNAKLYYKFPGSDRVHEMPNLELLAELTKRYNPPAVICGDQKYLTQSYLDDCISIFRPVKITVNNTTIYVDANICMHPQVSENLMDSYRKLISNASQFKMLPLIENMTVNLNELKRYEITFTINFVN